MNNERKILNNIDNNLKEIKEKVPLTHCITNFVTVNDCANAILAIGGSPIMAEDDEEVEEVVAISDVLVINIGKLSEEQIKSMKTSCSYANKINKPIVLDPVGVGISKLRNKTTLDIVKNYQLAAIRGNMSEIKAIATLMNLEVIKNNENQGGKGVDVAESDIINKDNLKENANIVKELSKELNTVIIASGPIDIISDGNETYAIENGDDMMPLITGSGCMLSSIVGTCIAATNPLEGSILASLLMSLSGESAREYVDENNLGTGSFRTMIIDNLYKTDSETIINKANIYEVK